jgi:dihydropteroate synthase
VGVTIALISRPRPALARAAGIALVLAGIGATLFRSGTPAPVVAEGAGARLWSTGEASVLVVDGPRPSAASLLELLRKHHVGSVSVVVVTSAAGSAATALRDVLARHPAGEVLAPAGSPLAPARPPQAGDAWHTGPLTVVVTSRGPPLVVDVTSVSSMRLGLGATTFDVTHRALVMGILNRTPDSFFDRGGYFSFDDFLRKADALVADGADFLDVGGVKAGPGPEVAESEELDRVVPAVAALHARFDLPISVDTWRASVLDAACGAGAVVANDISGFGDPNYLFMAARHGASVVATHIRLAPRVPDPEPDYPDGVVNAVVAFLAERAARAEAAGIPRERIMIDAGLDLGKTGAMSLELLRRSDVLARLGYPLFLSASNKTFLGTVLGLEVSERRMATVAAHALGIARGCRVLRAHDVRGSRRVADVMAAVLAARDDVRAPVSPESPVVT